ncbi:hypothetical protein CAP36_11090 [Chitinophagaceae bacterium IBVUCB2]|nr:hypothetical protein CAP36_11090 [Chitinophagaceae bacterium IBVUCB2]
MQNRKNKLEVAVLKKPPINQGLFQFGVILYQPSGMASKQNSGLGNSLYSEWRYRMTRAYKAICF